jgi:hypothetical protein
LILWKTQHAPTDTILEHGHVEVIQEPNVPTAQLEVTHQLRFVEGQKALDGLELHDHLVLHYQVQAVATLERDAFVDHRQRPLSLECDPAKLQLTTQTLLID